MDGMDQAQREFGKTALYRVSAILCAMVATYVARHEFEARVLADDSLVLKNLEWSPGMHWLLWLLRLWAVGALSWMAATLWNRSPEALLLGSAFLVIEGLERLRNSASSSEAGPVCLVGGVLMLSLNTVIVLWASNTRRKETTAKPMLG